MPAPDDLHPDPNHAGAADANAVLPRKMIVLISGARVALLGLWFAASIVMARVLGPAALGVYVLCQNAIRLFTDCLADPLDMAVMRDAPLYLRSDRARALETIRSAFWLRAGLGIASVAVTAAMPWVISRVIFGSPDQRGLVLITACGILGDLLLRSALGYFQVGERFGRFIVVDAVWQFGRAGAVVVLAWRHLLTAQTAVGLYVAAPYLAFAIAWVMLPSDVKAVAPPHRKRLSEILHYSKWMVAAIMMGAVYERLDIFLLEWFRGQEQVGFYAGALTLAMIPDSLNSIVQTVLAPKVALAFAAGTFRQLQREYLFWAAPLGVVAAVAAWVIGGPIIRMVLSERFVQSIVPFKILVLGTLFNLIVMPLPTALLSFVAPKKVALVTLAGLLLVGFGGLVCIPRFGAIGAAGVILAVRLVVGMATLILGRGLKSSPQMRAED